jgi:CubicO group peptidase (beta-lactamase class C family)
VRLTLAAFLAVGAAVVGAPQHWSESQGALIDATAGQDARFRIAFDAVDGWIRQGAFPGAVLAVGQHGSLLALKAFGRIEYTPESPAITTDEIFDLASLSKVIGTTSAAAILYDEHKLLLDAPVMTYVPEFAGMPEHAEVTIRELLTHSSGIPTPGLMYQKANNKIGILRQIYAVPLATPPGTWFKYRDPNFILLGDVIERVSGQPLDVFLQEHVFAPLEMTSTEYKPSPSLLGRIAPTEMDNILRHHVVRGEVHDENCYMMGGVCGHAGLFSTAGDLAIYAQMLLNGGAYGGQRIFPESTVKLFTKRQNIPIDSTRALGWDTPAPDSFSGGLASPCAILHTGFTGTSIYIDFERDAFIILLTNRVYPTRKNEEIAAARPDIHSAVFEALDQQGLPGPQTPQNPSPMVEHTRLHPRLEPQNPPGRREELELGTLFIPARSMKASRLKLLFFFHPGSSNTWLPEVAAASRRNMAVITVQSGEGSSTYARLFADRARFSRLIAEAENKSRAKFSEIDLGGWSAGCGAEAQVLRDPDSYRRVDRVLCIDGIHTGYLNGKPGPLESQINTAGLHIWVEFGRDAIAGKKRLIVTHSEIFPGTFASTTETADYLLGAWGLQSHSVLKWGPMRTQILNKVQAARLVMIGFAGNSGPDHVDEMQSLPEYLKWLMSK